MQFDNVYEPDVEVLVAGDSGTPYQIPINRTDSEYNVQKFTVPVE